MGNGWISFLVLVKLSGEVVSGKVGMGTLYCRFLPLGTAAYLNRGRIEIGLSAIGAIGIPIVYIGMYFTDPLFEAFEFAVLP